MESWFSEKERGKVEKDHIARINNEENSWDHVEGDAVVCVSREDVLQALNEMKSEKSLAILMYH